MKKELPISIIIPTFNREEALKRTLFIINKYSRTIPNEVIVVDQSIKQESRKRIRDCCNEFASIKCRYIFLETPSSTKARNIGIEKACNDILVFMDDDVDVNCDTLGNIYKLLCNESIAMVGVIDETLPTSGGKLGCLFCMKSYRNRNIGHVTKALLGRYPQNVKGTVDTMWAMGFCFAVKKQYVTKWNLFFDEKLTGYAYAEDLDFTYRYYRQAKKCHFKCLLSENVSVRHLESKEYRIPSQRNVFKYVINRKYLAYKYELPISTHILMCWSNIGLMVSRIVNHEPFYDIIAASRRCHRLKKYLKNGIIREEFFDDDFCIKSLEVN